MNQDEIKIIRLKNGDDIIGIVNAIDNYRYNIRYPMIVEVVDTQYKQAYILTSWLSHQMFKTNEVNLFENDILFVSETTDLFVSHYLDSVKRLEDVITETEIEEFLEEDELINQALMDKENSVLH